MEQNCHLPDLLHKLHERLAKVTREVAAEQVQLAAAGAGAEASPQSTEHHAALLAWQLIAVIH